MQPSLLLRLAPALVLAGCASADARTIPVSTDEALRSAVASARAGDRIELAPGGYAPLLVVNRKIEGGSVTLTGKGASVKNIEIVRSSGWTLDGLEIGGGAGNRGRVIYIEASSDLAIRNSHVHGINVNNDPWDDGVTGIGLRAAKNVQIVGNRLRDLGNAIIIGSSSNVRVEGNSLAYIREGMNLVALKSGVIRCNRVSHVFPNWLRKEHPDAIQGWWNKDGNNEDLLIEGNVLVLGGPRAVQGIFLAGAWQPKDDPVLGKLRRLTIRDNIYYGASRHGISISGTEDAVVERNTILPSPWAAQPNPPPRSQDGRRSSAIVPRISVVGDGSTGRVSDNLAVTFVLPPLVEDRNNEKLAIGTSGSGTPWKKVFVTPPSGDLPPLESFAVDPKSKSGQAGRGARPICGDTLPPALPADSPDPSREQPQT